MRGFVMRFRMQNFVEPRDIDGFGHERFGDILADFEFERRRQNHARRMVQMMRALRQFNARHARHFDIGNHEIKRLTAQQIQRLPTVLGDCYGMTGAAERNGESEKHIGIIIDEQNLGHVFHRRISLISRRNEFTVCLAKQNECRSARRIL